MVARVIWDDDEASRPTEMLPTLTINLTNKWREPE